MRTHSAINGPRYGRDSSSPDLPTGINRPAPVVAAQPARGRCWPWGHRWAHWEFEGNCTWLSDGVFGLTVQHRALLSRCCLDCGKEQKRCV